MKFEYINMANEKAVVTVSLIKDVDLAALILIKKPEDVMIINRSWRHNRAITELIINDFLYVRLTEDYWIYFENRVDLGSIAIDPIEFCDGCKTGGFYLGVTDGYEYCNTNKLLFNEEVTAVIALPATGMSISGLSYIVGNPDELVNNFARFYVKANAHFYQVKLTCDEAKELCNILIDRDIPEKIIDRVGEAITNLIQYTRSAERLKVELSKKTPSEQYRDILDELASMDAQRNKLVRELAIAKAEFLSDVCQDYQQTRTSKVGKPHIVVFRGTKR